MLEMASRNQQLGRWAMGRWVRIYIGWFNWSYRHIHAFYIILLGLQLLHHIRWERHGKQPCFPGIWWEKSWFPPWIQGAASLHLCAVVVAAVGEIHSGDLSDRHQFSWFLDHLGHEYWNLMKVDGFWCNLMVLLKERSLNCLCEPASTNSRRLLALLGSSS